MAKPKALAKRRPGQPTKYVPGVIDQSLEYLKECIDSVRYEGSEKRPMRIIDVKIPTIEGLALRLEVSRETLYQWEKDYPEFSDILMRVRAAQAERLISKGLSGDYNPVISKLLLAKHGYIDRADVTSDGGAVQPILVEFMKPDTKLIEEGEIVE